MAAELADLASELADRAIAVEQAFGGHTPFMLADEGAEATALREAGPGSGAVGRFVREIELLRARAKRKLAKLTRREFDVLRELSTGASNKEIGRRLGISDRTVEIHRMNMLAKVGPTNAEALRLWVYTELPVILR